MPLLRSLALIRNVGTFDSVTAGNNLPLTEVSVVYAENGRGKTTIAAILNSLATGDASLILERTRLNGQGEPHLTIRSDLGTHVFQHGAWSRPVPSVVVFDDAFVSKNVCSGQKVEADHRQNLHELILGVEGVLLNDELLLHVETIETHNTNARTTGAAITELVGTRVDLDIFCLLPADPDLETKIAEIERGLTIARSAEAIINHREFSEVGLPRFDLPAIETLLGSTVTGLDRKAVERLGRHFTSLGDRGEEWVAEGVPRVLHTHGPSPRFLTSTEHTLALNMRS
jgi:hypothetical protein